MVDSTTITYIIIIVAVVVFVGLVLGWVIYFFRDKICKTKDEGGEPKGLSSVEGGALEVEDVGMEEDGPGAASRKQNQGKKRPPDDLVTEL